MKLRSLTTRPALAEVSGNPNVRKRKASVAMIDAAAFRAGKRVEMDENVQKGSQRKVGRPRKESRVGVDRTMEQQASDRTQVRPPMNWKPQSAGGVAGEFADDTDLHLRLEPSPSLFSGSSEASPGKVSKSPCKKGQVTLDRPTSEAGIDMNYLRRCDPAVKLTDFSNLRKARKEAPTSVFDLYKKLRDIPHGLIPSALETRYVQDADTPRKSNEPHSKSSFLEAVKTPFPSHCLDRMKSTVDNVLEKAKRAHSQNAHEKQWGALVNQVLCEVECWQKESEQIVVLNVETCSIQPAEIRPKRPGGGARIDCDVQSQKSDAKTNTTSENMGRMVDWCLAMNVDQDDMDVIEQAFAKMADNACSLNQSLSYIRNNSLLLDFEIKKTLQPRDPQVQLAIWASSALLKKRLHGWNTLMPMPAIVVNGHSWTYYIFFEMDKDLMMAGPYDFGTTGNLNGIWTIYYRLHVIAEWGRTKYKEWFEENVVEWARERCDGEVSS